MTKKIVSILLVILTVMSIMSISFVIGSAESAPYTFELLDDDTYKLTGYDAAGPQKVNVPDKYEEKAVTVIGDSAFKDLTNVASISLPSSIVTVENNAMYNCVNLKTLTVEGKDTVLDGCGFGFTEGSVVDNAKVIGKINSTAENYAKAYNFTFESNTVIEKDGMAFLIGQDKKATLIAVQSGKKTIEVPAVIADTDGVYDVTVIGDSAFSIQSVIEGIKYYSNTPNVKTVKLPNSIITIDSHAFAYLDYLTTVNIPNSCKEIKKYAFYNLKAMKSITVPKTVTSIGTRAIGFLNKKVIKGFKINSTVGSVAQTYATKNDIIFTTVEKPVLKSISKVSGGIKLKWTALAAGTKYRVFYKTSKKWKTIGDTTKTSYKWKGALDGKTYALTVRCLDANNNKVSGYDSKGLSILYYSCDMPRISKCENTQNAIKITWDKVSGAAKYRVFVHKSSGKWKNLATTTATSYIAQNPKSGKSYTYTVRCVSKDGKTFTSLFDKNGYKQTFYACPTIKSVSNQHAGSYISWNESKGADGYYVYQKTNNGDYVTVLKATTDTFYYNKKAVNGYTYSYMVVAVKKVDGKYVAVSAYSPVKSKTFFAAPKFKSISRYKTEKGSNAIKLTWSKVSGIAKYRVYIKYGAMTQWTKVKDIGADSLGITGAKAGTKYTFIIVGLDKSDNIITGYYPNGISITY